MRGSGLFVGLFSGVAPVLADERTYSYANLDGESRVDLGGILLVLAALWFFKKAGEFVMDLFCKADKHLQDFLIVPAGYALWLCIGYPFCLYIGKSLNSPVFTEWVTVISAVVLLFAGVHIYAAWRDYQSRSE